MQSIINAIISFSNWLWGIPMLVILVGGSIFITIRLGFVQFRYFPFAMQQTFGNIFKKSEGEGTISAFQAATTALASCIGAANIVGVPVAIAFGGPGAVFWMWVIAFIGAGAKFSEIVVAIHYREKNLEGEYVGGPMYYLSKGIKGPLGKAFGLLFSFFLMIEIAPSISAQTVSVVQSASTINISNWVVGIVLALIVGIVTYGGIKRIGQVAEKLVPFMSILYVIGAIAIIITNIKELPSAIASIFKYAFTPAAAVGGFAGATITQAIRWGMARGVYSNESGMGTAPIAHAAATTDHPVRQAMWGLFENVVATLIVCTASALVVLVTGLYQSVPANEAGTIPSLAFQTILGKGLGGAVVTISLILFVLSTIIAIVYYGEKQAEYLFGIKFSKVMRIIYIASILLGAMADLEFIYQFMDFMLALVIIPNMLGLLLLSGKAKELKDEFFSSSKYYDKA